MLRVLSWCLAGLFALPYVAAGQSQATLSVSVTLGDQGQPPAPVPGHGLLISDNPATAPPRRVVTGADGRVSVRLRPGNYTIESERAVASGGRSYEWIVTLDVGATGETLLSLTAANAEVGTASADTPAASSSVSTVSRGPSPSLTLQQWTPAVVALWTSTVRASGVVVDSRGLVATTARSLGAAPVAVQFGSGTKVEGRILADDAAKDVALIAVAPEVVAGIAVLAPPCASSASPPAEGDELFALGVPLNPSQDTLRSGLVRRTDTSRIEADLRLARGATGGPVFSEAAHLIGFSSRPDGDEQRPRDFPVVPVAALCELLQSAGALLSAAGPVSTAPLPVEPSTPVPADLLAEAVSRRGGDLSPYSLTGTDFDVAFITPVMTFAAQQPPGARRTTSRDTNRTLQEEYRLSRQMAFGDWSEYVASVPPVLLVKVTPKMTEGFWRTIARGAAMTQGIPLPPGGKPKARLADLRVRCGEAEVVPIHQLTVRTPFTDSEPFEEGLFVFAPGAVGSRCGTVTLELQSDREPRRPDLRRVDAAVLARIDQDMALLDAR
ncbi:MAG: serine protease [Vicinamibacterales bacterium]